MFCCKGVIMESKKDEIVVFNHPTLVLCSILKKLVIGARAQKKSRGASSSKRKIWDKNN
jgi:hypothetical protein